MKGVKGYNAMYVFYGHTTRCNETVLYRNDQKAKIIYCTFHHNAISDLQK